MNIVDLTAASFDSMISQHALVVIDFWAEWCGPCKAFAKVVESVAPDYPEVLFAKINIEKEPDLAEEFQVRSVPLIMILREQVVVYAESGALSASSLIELLQQAKALDPEELKKRVTEEGV